MLFDLFWIRLFINVGAVNGHAVQNLAGEPVHIRNLIANPIPLPNRVPTIPAAHNKRDTDKLAFLSAIDIHGQPLLAENHIPSGLPPILVLFSL